VSLIEIVQRQLLLHSNAALLYQLHCFKVHLTNNHAVATLTEYSNTNTSYGILFDTTAW
jgi:hypothetical protein